MNSTEKIALWSVLNAYSKKVGCGRLTLTDMEVWWERYQSELDLEVAYKAIHARRGIWD